MNKIHLILKYNSPGEVVNIGRRGEKDVNMIVIDIADFQKKFGPGRAEIVHKNLCMDDFYLVETEQTGTELKWIVSEADTFYPGNGVAVLRYYPEYGKAKSCMIMTKVKKSLDETEGPAPDPVRDWVDQAAEFLGTLKALNIVQDVSFDGDMLNIALYDGSVKQINFKAVLEAYNFAKQGTSYTKEESDEKYLTDHQPLDGYAKETYVNEKVAELVDQAPETLDTLKELSDALGNDPNFATTILAKIGEKANSDNVYTKEETDVEIIRKVGASNTAFENYYDGVLANALESFGNQAAEQLATKQSRDIYLEYGKPIVEQGFESVEDIIGLAMVGVTVNVVDFFSNEFAIMSRVDEQSYKLVFCNDKHIYTISLVDGSWEKEDAYADLSLKIDSIDDPRVLAMHGSNIISNGRVVDVIGVPEYIDDLNSPNARVYKLTKTGWYVFAKIFNKTNAPEGGSPSVSGHDGMRGVPYTSYVDIAVWFGVTAETKLVTVDWDNGELPETFVFKAPDLGIRNLDYRVTFYLYNIDDYCTWEYQLTTDTTFVAGKGYYKLQNGQYVKQEVTTGASVPANTYYVHKSLTIRGFTRNMSYTLDTTVDCPVTIHLPEVGGDNYGAWFEVQMNFLAAYSVTVVPSPGQKVSANGVNTPKVGINIVNILYHKPTNTWLPTLTNWKVSES